MLIDDVFIINDTFYGTRYKYKYCISSQQNELNSIFLSAKEVSQKGHEMIVEWGPIICIFIRLMLVYERGLS